MRAYINFQFATLRKKVGPYIIAALALVLIGLLAILSARSANNEGASSIKSIATFTKFFPFLFAVLFSALVITHIFKEGETDGSELIVVAKPLTRMQIVIGKFILSLAYVFAFQVIMFLGYIAFTQFDKYSTEWEKMKWALSLFIGGIIVQVIASSIIVMLASALGKIGTIVVSILFGAALPILSFILVPIGKGWRAGSIDESMYQTQAGVNIAATDGNYIYDDASKVYEQVTDEKQFNDKYGDGGWYKGAAYLDIWYHWGRFYSALMPTDSSDVAIVKWQLAQGQPDTSVLHTASQGDWRIVFNNSQLDKRSTADRDALIKARINTVDLTNLNGLISANKTAFDNASLLDRMAFVIKQHPAFLSSRQFQYEINDFVWKGEQTGNVNVNAVAALAILNKVNGLNVDKFADVTDFSKITALQSLNMFKADSKFVYLQPKDYLPTGAVIGIWSVIGIAMCGAALLIYSRRDFK